MKGVSNIENMILLSGIINASDFILIQRRLIKLSVPEPNTGCHIWIGATTIAGYGIINIKKKILSAHRVSYFLNKGDIPDGLVIDHICDNKFCINPDHLQPKTQLDNLLRSNSASMVNLRKTHCNKGHEFTESNTIINKNGSRDCKICVKAKKKRHYNNRREHILSVKKKYWEKNKKATLG